VSLRQVADGAARQMKRVWLGPKGMRWPFDATFVQFGVGVLFVVAYFFLLWLVVPPVIAVGVAVWQFSTRLARLLSAEHEVRTRRLLAGSCWLLLVLLAPNPSLWVFPMPFWLAGPAAAILGVLSVRQVGRFIDWNRPVGYWLAMPRRVAAGPRLRPEREINPEALRLEES